jgi:uncharacterized protein YndB with AHSA1/START domain
MSSQPLVIEKLLHAPAARVWEALTENVQMKQWYFNLSEFKPETGFEFEFTGGSEEQQYVHRCRITEVIPGKKLAYSWRYKDYPGDSLVSFELFPDGGDTLVRITHTGLETFPQASKDFGRESFTAGWNYILGESLRKFVEEEKK